MRTPRRLILSLSIVVAMAAAMIGFAPTADADPGWTCGGDWCVTHEVKADGCDHYIGFQRSTHKKFARKKCGEGNSQTDTGWVYVGTVVA